MRNKKTKKAKHARHVAAVVQPDDSPRACDPALSIDGHETNAKSGLASPVNEADASVTSMSELATDADKSDSHEQKDQDDTAPSGEANKSGSSESDENELGAPNDPARSADTSKSGTSTLNSDDSDAQSGSASSAGVSTENAEHATVLPVDVGDSTAKKGLKNRKVPAIVFGTIAAVLAVVYLAGALVFMDRFLPRTTVGDIDVSFKSSAEVQTILADVIDDYTLKVDGQGFSLKISAVEVGMKLDGRAATDAMHARANAWAWPVEILKTHDESDALAATYNESGLGNKVRTAVDDFNKKATPPTDATIVYSDTKDAFIVKSEAMGTELDYDAVLKLIDDAALALEPTLTLKKDVLRQPKVLSDDPRLATAAEQANSMIKADLVLMMGEDKAAEVNGKLISEWVRLDEELITTLDEEALTSWVNELVEACNTVGTERIYTRPDGKVVTVAGGVYGWSVDHDAVLTLVQEAVANGTEETVEMPCTTTGAAYKGAGARDWGARYCDVDLAEQYARFYNESGELIWESPIVSGTPDGAHDTPTGVYWVNQKSSPAKLTGWEGGKKIYESIVQYWMPFVANTIGLHDANWQSSFGGTRYRNGAGSHGCVNLPPSKAAELYGIIQEGDVVVTHW